MIGLIPLSLSLYFLLLYKLNPSSTPAAPTPLTIAEVLRGKMPPQPVESPEPAEEVLPPAERPEEMGENPLRVDPPQPLENPGLPVESPEEVDEASLPVPPRAIPRKAAPGSKTCPHYIGYLTHLPRGSPFPDECFGCREVVRCMRIEPAQVVESFYLEAQS
jgi:hypothetical protein